MIPFKIGNWEINKQGIEWKGETGRELLIDKARITETGFSERKNTYDWLVHLTEKSWLTRTDIYALNSAFIYAISYFELDLSSNSFVKTFIEQEKQLALVEANENEDEITL
jgi:hypothetical protein